MADFLDDNDEQEYGSANYNFDFLDEYIKNILSPKKTEGDELVEGDDLYNERSDELDIGNDDLDPIINSNDDYEEGPTDEPQGSDENENDYLYGDSYEAYTGNNSNNSVAASNGSIKNAISGKESQGNYAATNPNSSATGKYQFLWSEWGDAISKVTGIKSKVDFLHNPQAQEKWYAYYEKNYLMPKVADVRKKTGTKLSDVQLAKLVHFRGPVGAVRWLTGQDPDKPESYNMPTSKYIKQNGGTIAVTPQAQYVGLNNSSFDSMVFPLEGINTIRGLDSGEPVEVKDSKGNKKILYGPNHTMKVKGPVFEKRVK